ncbi:stretch-activated cation channel Mid1 [Geopyxis carbonaria]|nr:stretch-activated cation channel Mid1 [Geopyxis carbonaria]
MDQHRSELRKREDDPENDFDEDDNVHDTGLEDWLERGGDEEGAGGVVEKRQSSRRRTVHLTLNTCTQPQVNTTAKKQPGHDPPQLMVYVSNTTANKAPGPDVKGKAQFNVPVELGFAQLDFEATGDVWVGVYAPGMPKNETGMWVADPQWNYELALSTKEPYHGFRQDQFLYLVDTDDTTALLITGNMTEESAIDGGVNESGNAEAIMARTPPYTMFAQNRNASYVTSGLERSYCAIRQLLRAPDSSMTTRGLGNLPKQQFHLKQLNRSSEYLGYLARPHNISDPSDTSGILWQPMSINTKKDGNCQIIYNLDFCAEVAYAVPSNPTLFPSTESLTTFYDSTAQMWHNNFTYSLQQIPCHANSASTYSLVRNCADCAAAYKNWLCAVTIPRCMDYSSPLPYLAERSSTQLFWNATADGWQKHPFMPVLAPREVADWKASGGWAPATNITVAQIPSRNRLIDQKVMPGAYKEVKPCKDLCWSLVQDCPANMGFQCPKERSWGMEMSYGERDTEGDVTCSYLGAVYFLNAAPRVPFSWPVLLAVAAVAMWFTAFT